MLSKKDKEWIDSLLKKRISPLEKDIKHLKGDVKVVIRLFDRENLDLRKRVSRLEQKVGLSPLN